MDPITTAIVAALPALAGKAVKDAYEGLKAVIRRRWGETAPIAKAITALEEDPQSKAQAAVLGEKVGAVKATEDAEVAQALHRLVEELKSQGIGGNAVAKIEFNISGGVVQGIAAAENVTIGSITFTTPLKG